MEVTSWIIDYLVLFINFILWHYTWFSSLISYFDSIHKVIYVKGMKTWGTYLCWTIKYNVLIKKSKRIHFYVIDQLLCCWRLLSFSAQCSVHYFFFHWFFSQVTLEFKVTQRKQEEILALMGVVVKHTWIYGTLSCML